ncbi:MAG: hypothetical protein J5511_03285 [Bacilli bacterium]|nr:hypothetical protein [Bacilli bacterium]
MAKYFVYFSFTGNGDYIASLLKEKGYEPVKIELEKSPKKIGFWQILKYGGHAGFNTKEKLKEVEFKLNQDDIVIIGSPIWNDRLSTPITTFMSQVEFNKETTKFILYPAGEKTKKSLKQIKKLGFTSEPIVISYPLKKTEECKKLIEGAF